MDILVEIEDRLSRVEEKSQKLEIEIDKLFKEIEELRRVKVKTRIVDIERKLRLITAEVEDAEIELKNIKDAAFGSTSTKGISNPGVIA